MIAVCLLSKYWFSEINSFEELLKVNDPVMLVYPESFSESETTKFLRKVANSETLKARKQSFSQPESLAGNWKLNRFKDFFVVYHRDCFNLNNIVATNRVLDLALGEKGDLVRSIPFDELPNASKQDLMQMSGINSKMLGSANVGFSFGMSGSYEQASPGLPATTGRTFFSTLFLKKDSEKIPELENLGVTIDRKQPLESPNRVSKAMVHYCPAFVPTDKQILYSTIFLNDLKLKLDELRLEYSQKTQSLFEQMGAKKFSKFMTDENASFGELVNLVKSEGGRAGLLVDMNRTSRGNFMQAKNMKPGFVLSLKLPNSLGAGEAMIEMRDPFQ